MLLMGEPTTLWLCSFAQVPPTPRYDPYLPRDSSCRAICRAIRRAIRRAARRAARRAKVTVRITLEAVPSTSQGHH